MISVTVKDFGPIIEGAVELRPLTVFIGPNNSGKSHLATLVYALMQGGLPPVLPGMEHLLFYDKVAPQIFGPDREMETEIDTWIAKKIKDDFDFPSIPLSSLPERFVQALETASKEQIFVMFARPFDDSASRCFGSEISALSRYESDGSKRFSVSLKHDSPEWHLSVMLDGNEIEANVPTLSFANESVKVRSDLKKLYGAAVKRRTTRPKRMPRVRTMRKTGLTRKVRAQIRSSAAKQGKAAFERYRPEFIREISIQVFNAMYRQFPNIAYYMPAARSGILQSHKQLASAIVRRSALAGIEPLDVGRLSGVVADFISELLTLEPGTRGELHEVAEFLEKKIARGQVYLESAGAPYPEIRYEAQGQKYPMHRASSMVSELAPLILYLKHRLAPGDLLIFEEPESHLHPANQRILAHAIVKMVRKGVKVMLTTHSDYFLPQLGNFVRLSALEDERAKMGYGADDYLNPEDVGCYLFKLDYEEGGSVVRELEVSAAEGIIEEEFYDVSEALYNEYVDLERTAIKSSVK